MVEFVWKLNFDKDFDLAFGTSILKQFWASKHIHSLGVHPSQRNDRNVDGQNRLDF